jgi:uncharacterized damage-inducible protein DinB
MLAQSLLPEFDHEMKTTRSLLERVPADRAEWKPHPKSSTLGHLAAHLSNLPFWGVLALTGDEFDQNPPDGPKYERPKFESTEQILGKFDENVRHARELLERASDEQLMAPWSLKNGGQTILTLPKIAVLRTWMINHSIHHRGQLSVYLRENDVPLPQIYGPTADA